MPESPQLVETVVPLSMSMANAPSFKKMFVGLISNPFWSPKFFMNDCVAGLFQPLPVDTGVEVGVIDGVAVGGCSNSTCSMGALAGLESYDMAVRVPDPSKINPIPLPVTQLGLFTTSCTNVAKFGVCCLEPVAVQAGMLSQLIAALVRGRLERL